MGLQYGAHIVLVVSLAIEMKRISVVVKKR